MDDETAAHGADPCVAAQDLVDGRIYAIQTNDGLRVKRVQTPVSGGVILLSDNPIYKPEHVTRSDLQHIRIIGHVVWTERLL